jgi:polysaccharide export outer membrane protein
MLISKLAYAQLRVLLASLCLLLGFPAAGAFAQPASAPAAAPTDYRIAPGDSLQIFVWRNPELTTTVPVRPDGKISIPLVEDVAATGSTPSELARVIEQRLSKYVTNPNVTVLVNSFAGSFDQQVRIVGEATTPKAILY